MIFNPVDVMGPAHKANQTLQQLAQAASQSVLRRQKMRSLIAQGARGPASPGTNQPFRSSMSGRPGGVKSSVLFRMLGGQGAGVGNGHGNDGAFGNAGGGFDFSSIPAPADPAQSMRSTDPGPVAQVPAAPANAGGAASSDPLANGGSFHTADPNAGTSDNFSPIHLGNGLYYDPVTDSVVRGDNAVNPVGSNVHTGGSQF